MFISIGDRIVPNTNSPIEKQSGISLKPGRKFKVFSLSSARWQFTSILFFCFRFQLILEVPCFWRNPPSSSWIGWYSRSNFSFVCLSHFSFTLLLLSSIFFKKNLEPSFHLQWVDKNLSTLWFRIKLYCGNRSKIKFLRVFASSCLD